MWPSFSAPYLRCLSRPLCLSFFTPATSGVLKCPRIFMSSGLDGPSRDRIVKETPAVHRRLRTESGQRWFSSTTLKPNEFDVKLLPTPRFSPLPILVSHRIAHPSRFHHFLPLPVNIPRHTVRRTPSRRRGGPSPPSRRRGGILPRTSSLGCPRVALPPPRHSSGHKPCSEISSNSSNHSQLHRQLAASSPTPSPFSKPNTRLFTLPSACLLRTA